MSADPSIPGPSSQTESDFARSGTVPLRQHLQTLTDAAASRIEQQVKLVEQRLDQRIEALGTSFNDKLQAAREPVVTLREHLTVQLDNQSRLSSERLAVINGEFKDVRAEIVAHCGAIMTRKIEMNRAAAELATSRLEAAKQASDAYQVDIDRRFTMTAKVAAEELRTFSKAIDDRFAAREKTVAEMFNRQTESVLAAMGSSEKAVLKAEAANERRFEAVNEFRAQLNDMISRLLPRGEAEARINSIGEKIDSVGMRLTAIEARTAGASSATVEAREVRNSGNSQTGLLTAMIVGGIGVLVGVGGLAMNIANNSSRIQDTNRAIIERVVP